MKWSRMLSTGLNSFCRSILGYLHLFRLCLVVKCPEITSWSMVLKTTITLHLHHHRLLLYIFVIFPKFLTLQIITSLITLPLISLFSEVSLCILPMFLLFFSIILSSFRFYVWLIFIITQFSIRCIISECWLASLINIFLVYVFFLTCILILSFH